MRTLFLLLSAVSLLFAADLQVEATGYGVSEAQAIQLAQREALAKGIGQILISQTEVENFMVKKDLVLTRTAGNVKSYELLSKSRASDGSWEVKIRAVVSEEGLKNDLKGLMLLRESIGNPRIAFLIDENNSNSSSARTQHLEMLLAKAFNARGFETVDPNTTLRFRESKEAVAALGGDPEAAAKLGASLNAEVIVVGTATSTATDLSDNPHFKGTGMKSASATVALKAIAIGTRKILAASSANASEIDPNPEKAGQKAFAKVVEQKIMSTQQEDSFFSQLVRSWSEGSKDGTTYELKVRGVTNFSSAKAVVTHLESVASKVNQRSYDKPRQLLSVLYIGSVQELCTQLDEAKLPSGKSFSVESCRGTVVELTLK